MEARILRAALLCGAVILSLGAGRPYHSVRSQHFIVSAPTKQLAEEITNAAEKYRRDLAMEWLGHELPSWPTPCPIRADVAAGLGAGGATTFVFQNNAPSQWTMQIQGSRERILDSVLPHEITHTVFATHFGRPLPRWADEGACTTVEHTSEKAKQDKFLIEHLTSDPPRGIAFNKMFLMKEYPRDILPLYSQGYSLARFFIQQGGKRKFVEYVGEGMRTNNWTATTRKFYGFGSLSDLQLTWVEWVRNGSPAFPDGKVPEMLLVSSQPRNASAAATPLPGAPPGRNVASTQMASLTQQPRSRIPAGPPASWQTVQAQNARTFAEAEDFVMPQPASFAGQAANPAESSMAEASSVSRPFSEGWYARRRDQAQAVLGGGLEAAPAVEESEVRRTPIEAVPGKPAPTPAGDRRVLLEWKRPSEQPYHRSAAMTGVALHEPATLLR